MDLRERYYDQEDALRAAFDAMRAEIWTSLPVIVESYDKDKQTVSVRPSVKSVTKDPDGKTQTVEIPLLEDVPVAHPSAGGATVTFPIKKGDEGWVDFSCRSIDAWHQQGDVQPQVDASMHSLSHGIFRPGGRSQPRKLKNVSGDSIQLRSDDDGVKHVVDLHPEKGLTHKSWDHSITFAEDALKTVASKMTDQAQQIVQQASGAIIKNAAKVLINCG